MAASEKERKAQMREEMKRQKYDEIERKTQEKLSILEKKEQAKLNQKVSREANKKQERYRQQFRKEIVSEVKKYRTEANSSVLQHFDEEEAINSSESVINMFLDSANAQTKLKEYATNLPENLNDLLSHIYSISSKAQTNDFLLNSKNEKIWNEIITLTTSLHLFQNIFQFDHQLDFDSLLSCLSADKLLLSYKGDSPSFIEDSLNSTSIKLEESTNEIGMDIDQISDANANAAPIPENPSMEISREFKQSDADEEAVFPASNPNSVPDLSKITAELDRIQLNLLKLLLPDIHSVFDFDQRDAIVEVNSKKDKNQLPAKIQQPVRFPLNQLTWVELTRMVLLNFLYNERNKTKDEIQNVFRGGKQIGFRINRNIIRHIRYRWYIRSQLPAQFGNNKIEDVGLCSRDLEDRLRLMDEIQSKFGSQNSSYFFDSKFAIKNQALEDGAIKSQSNLSRKTLRPFINLFYSEEEIISELNKFSDDISVPIIYRRCAKVFLKIFHINAFKNLIWEIDRETYSDYYDIIVRPQMLVSVASNLLNKAYDDGTIAGDEMAYENYIAQEFYQDMRLVALNCVSFNSEIPLVAQAHKLLHCLFRHMYCWVFSKSRPTELEMCNERYCLLNNQPITNMKTDCIKCGKCLGVFHLDSLQDLSNKSSRPYDEQTKQLVNYIIFPTQELINQVNEEWLCPFCLREDSILFQKQCTVSSEEGNFYTDSVYYINEWGPSSTLPWLLNSEYTNEIKFLQDQSPWIMPIIRALEIIARPQSTSLLSASNNSETSTLSSYLRTWTCEERITILSSLCIILRNTSTCRDHLHRINTDCDKLVKLCDRSNFREADFMSLVKELCGDSGVAYCRNLLDGVGNVDESSNNPSFVTEGRCILCNTSTYEEDMQENPDESISKDILLCDGCNAEAHLRCLGLGAIPNSSWFCSNCLSRQSKREVKVRHHLDPVDQVRSTEEEEKLYEFCTELKLNGEDPFKGPDEDEKFDEDGEKIEKIEKPYCSYCGLTDLALCSPIVVGQSKSEHDQWVDICSSVPYIPNSDPSSSATTINVNFFYQGKKIGPPKLAYPFFPPKDSQQGKLLVSFHEDYNDYPIFVHELCALQMFQARVNRSRHTQRRKRRIIAERAVARCGVNALPLGYDRFGYEYWKFPFCNDLFIIFNSEFNSNSLNLDPDYLAFQKLINPNKALTGNATGLPRFWVRIQDTKSIYAIYSLCNDYKELKLRSNIMNELLLERLICEINLSLQDDAKLKESVKVNLLDSSESINNIAKEETEEAEILKNHITQEEIEVNKEEAAAKKRATAADIIPVAIKLFTNKGHDIPQVTNISVEKVFEDFKPQEGDDIDDEQFQQYFQYSRGRK